MDQDNAIVFAEGESGGEADRWFERLATRVADILHDVGVPYCKGGVMAKNPQWRGSLATWRTRVAEWIGRSRPQDLLSVDIFFDLDGVHGDTELASSLWRHGFETARGNVGFAKLLAESAGSVEPGLSFFGGFRTVEGRIDLKKAGLFGVVTLARVLAIRHHVVARSTPARLEGLIALGLGGAQDLAGLLDAQAVFLDLILAQQIEDIAAGIPATNKVAVKRVSSRDRDRLRAALGQVRNLGELTQDLLFREYVRALPPMPLSFRPPRELLANRRDPADRNRRRRRVHADRLPRRIDCGLDAGSGRGRADRPSHAGAAAARARVLRAGRHPARRGGDAGNARGDRHLAGAASRSWRCRRSRMFAATACYLRFVHGWDPLSALLGASPGSMAQVLALSAELGADLRGVAIVQTMRVLLIVLGLPGGSGAVRFDGGAARAAAGGRHLARRSLRSCWRSRPPRRSPCNGYGFPAACCSAPWPARDCCTASGSSTSPCRGGRAAPRCSRLARSPARASPIPARGMLLDYLGAAFGSFAVAVAIASCFALVVAALLPLRITDVFVAFAPGAQDTMMVLALALHLDPIYVGTHHLVRFLIVTFSVAVAARRLGATPTAAPALEAAGAGHVR